MKCFKSLLITIPALSLVMSCGGNDSSENLFLDATRQTLPVLSATTSVSEINWGTLSDEIKAILMDPDEDTTLGVNNIYHLLNDLDSSTANARGESCGGTSISGITSTPFFGTDPDSDGFFTTSFDLAYTCYDAYDSTHNTVGKKTGTVSHAIYALSGGCGSNTSCEGSSVYQGIYDESTGSLQVRLAGIWDTFMMRSEFYGNATSHTFTLRLTKGGTNVGAYWFKLVGYGVSRGTGYFLVRVSDDSHTDNYYCYNAATMNAEDVTATVASSDCASYRSIVDAIDYLEVASDLPDATFNIILSTH
ncbi:MAG: hypothetical protein JXA66_05555 [Oligoflexia bacterium]|nr:hypothetical protein [Oligoflexia bacterium]